MIRILHGDCLIELRTLADSGERFHACVTDPPYGLEFMGKEWDGADGFRRSLNEADAGRDSVFDRTSQHAPEYRTGPNWQSGAGFSKPGIGERETPWPAFTGGNDRFGGANPTCAACGGRARGRRKCACAEPDWRVKGAAPDPMYGRRRQMQTYQQWCEAWARAVYNVLLPGAYLLAFGGTRTSHRLACAIEDAGFEIRDTVAWLYGCLDAETEAVTPDGVKPYHKLIAGDPVLCYDPSDGGYSYQPILEVVEYDYSDTAFRLVGDFGEQVVTRNHRCIVERGGVETFQFAEEAAREREARVPILESLSELQDALRGRDQGTGDSQQGVLSAMRRCAGGGGEQHHDAARDAQGQSTGDMLELRRDILAQREASCAREDADVFEPLQWRASRGGVGNPRAQRTIALEAAIRGCISSADDRADQPSMEGRPDLPQPERQVCRTADQVRSLPSGFSADGAQGRVRDGAPADRGASDWALSDARRDSPSPEPQGNGERQHEPDVVCDERRAQSIRAWRGHRSAVVRIVPFHLTGKVWCLRVPTGAFIAVRGGVAFPTGNSGFPKSLDVSKAIDKAAGAQREVIDRVRVKGGGTEHINRSNAAVHDYRPDGYQKGENVLDVTVPATPEAEVWQGWGTALKPAFEPIVVARKPLDGTVAANVLKHGCGALNIDASRVEGPMNGVWGTSNATVERGRMFNGSPDMGEYRSEKHPLGRWPANVVHDGSEEVLAAFPDAPGQLAFVGQKNGARDSVNCYGDYGARPDTPPRGDTGSAARFFYTAKADKADRAGSKHPTVKPTDLMQYLVRLVTPPGGTILDPFMGTGSTLVAADQLQFNAVGIEKEASYVADARRKFEADAGLFAEIAPD